MQIHLAAWGQNGAGSAAMATTGHARVLLPVRYPHVLESYHYMSDKIITAARADNTKFFLDSGAFSMFTQGAKIDIESYAGFIKTHQDIIKVASNLDDITKTEKISYANQKRLEELGCTVQPVFHAREDERWLVKYLDEGYTYIFLGGLVPETTEWLFGWLDHIWHNYLIKDDGTPRIQVHGFGLTSLPLMFRYPWYSVDSTSWLMTASFGSIFMDMPQPNGAVKDFKVDFSSTSSKRHDIDSWHYSSLTEPERRVVLERLEQMEADRPKHPEFEAELEGYMHCKQGFNPDALAASYGWRRYANIEYFRRAMNRKVDRFVREQETLF